MRVVLNNFCHVFTRFDLRERIHGPYSDTWIAFKDIYIFLYLNIFYHYYYYYYYYYFVLKNKFD